MLTRRVDYIVREPSVPLSVLEILVHSLKPVMQMQIDFGPADAVTQCLCAKVRLGA